MHEVKLSRASSYADEILQTWMKAYEAARRKGLSEDEAKEHANSMTSFQTEQGWLETYAVSRWEGLSEGLAMSYSNAEAPEDKGKTASANEGHNESFRECTASGKGVACKPAEASSKPPPPQKSPADGRGGPILNSFLGLVKRLHLLRSESP